MIVGSPTILNLVPGGVMKCVHVNQVNKNIEIQFKVMNGAAPYNVPEGVTCTIRGTKGDAFGYAAEAAVTAGSNVITVTLTEQLTAVAGAGNIFELVFVASANDMKVSTENFILAVERQAMGEDTVISDSDLSYAEQVLDQLQSVGAVNEQVQQNKTNLAAEISRAQAAEAAETAARQAADNTLQSNINAEASTRATQDASLQSQINQLIAPSGSAPSAAEVENARVGADGTTYPTLGDAIRTQDTQLKNAIHADTGVAPISGWVSGRMIRNDGTTIGNTLAESGQRYTKVDCVPGEKFTINATGASAYRVYSFTDVNGTILEKGLPSVALSDTVLTAPENAAYLYINDAEPGGMSLRGASTVSQISEINTEIEKIMPGIVRLKDLLTVSGGGIYESTHVHRNSSVMCRTEPMLIHAGETVVAKLFASRAYSIISAYSSPNISAETYLNSIVGLDSAAAKTITWTAESDCYVVFSTAIAYVDEAYAYIVSTNNDAEKAALDKSAALAEHIKKPSNLITNIIPGKSINASGVIGDNENRMMTNRIPASYGDHFAIQTWQGSTRANMKWLAVYYYDSADVYISRAEFIESQFSDGYLFAPIIVNAANCAYMIVSAEYVNGDKNIVTVGSVESAYGDASDIATVYHNDFIISANHRGFYTFPENTVLAFAESKRRGFTHIENDVRWTSDGVAVLLHDTSINRVARNADGTELTETVNIADITYAQALTYDFGIYKGAKFAGTKICTLEECLAFCRNAGIGVLLEPKVGGHAAEIIAAVKKYGLMDHTVFMAFNSNILNQIYALAPKATYGVVRSGYSDGLLAEAIALKNDDNIVYVSVNYTSPTLTQEAINTLIANDICLAVYTVDSESAIINLDPYVTSVTSDNLVAGDVLAAHSLN